MEERESEERDSLALAATMNNNNTSNTCNNITIPAILATILQYQQYLQQYYNTSDTCNNITIPAILATILQYQQYLQQYYNTNTCNNINILQAPHVHLSAVLSSRDEQLRGCVLWTATVSLQKTARPLSIAQSKI